MLRSPGSRYPLASNAGPDSPLAACTFWRLATMATFMRGGVTMRANWELADSLWRQRHQLKCYRPPGVSAWMAIAAGYMHSLAIGNDCALYCWGANDAGQMGIGPVPQQPQPVRVPNVGVLCGTPVIYTEGALERLEDGSIRLRFSSDLNRSYYIQYTDNLAEWKTALPAVTGTGGIAEWLDDGPPKTESHPSTASARSYRVVFAP